jgi:hypothetical protein
MFGLGLIWRILLKGVPETLYIFTRGPSKGGSWTHDIYIYSTIIRRDCTDAGWWLHGGASFASKPFPMAARYQQHYSYGTI